MTFFPYLISFNKGIAFGMLVLDWIFLINFFLLLLTAVFVFRKNNLGWSLVMGGGIANLLDRFFYQGVVDFLGPNLSFKLAGLVITLPKFNLADVFIVMGAVLVIVKVLKNKNKKDILV